MEQCFGHLRVEIFPEKHCDFSTYLAKSARAKSGAFGEWEFEVYGQELWSQCGRMGSRETKSLQLHHLSYQESESSVSRMRRGAVS
jgi:hypothetical protein